MSEKGNPPVRGGRGRFGRGGRGIGVRHHIRTGTIPAIGAYLDISPGRDINPGVVTTWMIKLSEYIMSSFDSRIDKIFGPDGTLGEYPEIIAPDDPEEGASRVDIKKWETSYSDYNKERIKLEQDKCRVYGIMLGQISDNSKNRIKETEDGAGATLTHDPLQLLSAIISTHMSDNRLGAEHNLYKVEQAFYAYSMQNGDSLAYYYQRFRALLTGVQEAYRRADEDIPDTSFRDFQLALKFTMGLNSTYSVYKQYYEDSIKEWPDNLENAFFEASKFMPRTTQPHYSDGAGRAHAFAMRGRGRGRSTQRGGGRHGTQGRHLAGRGYTAPEDSSGSEPGGQSVYGTRKGNCHACGGAGHYSYECRVAGATGKGLQKEK